MCGSKRNVRDMIWDSGEFTSDNISRLSLIILGIANLGLVVFSIYAMWHGTFTH